MEEIEAKFSIPDFETYQQLESIRHLNMFTILKGQMYEVKDTYLDTAKQQLVNAGLACRVRQTGERCIVTLKVLSPAVKAVHHREELEMILPEPLPLSQWPDTNIREQIRAVAADVPLEPMFDLQQSRHRRPVQQGKKIVAELSLDTVRQVFRGHTQSYLELEIELEPDGSEESLQTLVHALQQAYNLSPQTASKFERGLAFAKSVSQLHRPLNVDEIRELERLAKRNDTYGRRARVLLAIDAGATRAEAGQRGPLSDRRVRYWITQFRTQRMNIFPAKLRSAPQPPARNGSASTTPAIPHPINKTEPPSQPASATETPGLTPDDTMAEAARKTLRFHFWQMLAHEPGAQLGEDREELHNMRVAARRMRAALHVFSGHLDAKAIKPHAKKLKRITQSLGTVRDLDVFYERTENYIATSPSESRPDLALLIQAWQQAYGNARANLDVYLHSERYNHFKEALGNLLDTPFKEPHSSLRNEVAIPCRVRHMAPVIIYQRLAEVRAFDEWMVGPNIPLTRYHRLRIATKYLRYTLEFFQEILGPEASTAIDELKEFQDHLGNLQDAVIASGRLRNFWIWGDWSSPAIGTPITTGVPVIAPDVAMYHAAQHSEIQQLLDTFPPVWQKFLSSDFNQLIARAVNGL